MKKIVLLCILVSVFLYVCAQNSEYPQWTTYLNNYSIVDIADAGDYLWINTADEVIKFEKSTGSSENYTNDDLGLDTEEDMTTIECDKNGVPFVGTDRGGVLKLVEDEWIYMRPNRFEEMAENEELLLDVTDIVTSENDTVWAGCRSGLVRFVGDSITLYDDTNSDINGYIASLATDNNGNLWLGTHQMLRSHFDALLKFDGQNWFIYNSSEGNSEPYVFTTIQITTQGKLWMGGFQAIYNPISKLVSFDEASWEFIDLPDPYRSISSLEIEDDSIIWIGSHDEYGLMRYANSNWTLYNKGNSGLPSNNVSSVVNDNNGILWVGTENGLAAYDKDISAVDFTSSTFDLKIFPNPVNEKLSIIVPPYVYDANVEIYSLQGKLLRLENITTNDIQVDVSNLSIGTYLISVKSKQNTWIGKFLKQ